MMGFARVFTRAMLSEQTAHQRGLLQSLDPRVRVVGVLALVLAVTLVRTITAAAVLFVLAITLAVASRIGLSTLLKRVWLVVLGFTGVVAVPAIFFTPGRVVATIATIPITEQGVRAACLLILRVEAAVTFTTILVLCTPWPHLLKALRSLGLPKVLVTMLAMTYRYVFLLVETAMQMFESRRSRTVGVLSGREQRSMAARTAGALLSKSIETSNEVFLAMRSRGFRGDVEVISDFHLTLWDCLGLALVLLVAGIAVWKGR